MDYDRKMSDANETMERMKDDYAHKYVQKEKYKRRIWGGGGEGQEKIKKEKERIAILLILQSGSGKEETRGNGSHT